MAAPLLSTIGAGIVAGLVATATKSAAESWLQPAAQALLPPTDSGLARPGADPAGHPERMPPAELIETAQHASTGRHADDETRTRLSPALHWGMGVGSAVVYAVLRERIPALTRGCGAVSGGVLFALTHATTLPVAGLQAPLTRLPRAALLWEPGSHLTYGVAQELVLRGMQPRRLPGA